MLQLLAHRTVQARFKYLGLMTAAVAPSLTIEVYRNLLDGDNSQTTEIRMVGKEAGKKNECCLGARDPNTNTEETWPWGLPCALLRLCLEKMICQHVSLETYDCG